MKYKLKDEVFVKIQGGQNSWPRGTCFYATVLDFDGDKYIVEDGDSECFTVEECELELRND